MMAKVPSFEWDEAKDRVNRRKHGVSFDCAQYAFFDRNRIVAEDLRSQWDRAALLLLWLGGRRRHDGAIYLSQRPHSHPGSGLLAERKEDL
jgi:hypothetical protein